MTNNRYKTIYDTVPIHVVKDSQGKLHFRVLTNPNKENRDLIAVEFVMSQTSDGIKIALNGECTSEVNDAIGKDTKKNRLKMVYHSLMLPEMESGMEMYDPTHPFAKGHFFRLYAPLCENIATMKPEEIGLLSNNLDQMTGMTSKSIHGMIKDLLEMSPDKLFGDDDKEVMAEVMNFAKDYNTVWSKTIVPDKWATSSLVQRQSSGPGTGGSRFIM